MFCLIYFRVKIFIFILFLCEGKLCHCCDATACIGKIGDMCEGGGAGAGGGEESVAFALVQYVRSIIFNVLVVDIERCF